MLAIGVDDFFEIPVLVEGPVTIRKDFNFDGAVKAGGFHKLADSAVIDAAFAHEPAVIEKVIGWGDPVADMEAYDSLAGSLNFLCELRIPPDVIDIRGDSDPVIAKLVNHVVALANRVDGAAAIGIHRVEGLDR